MASPRTPLATDYDAEHFRQFGHQLVDQLADHLARTTRREGPVLPWAPPEVHLANFPADFPEEPTGDVPALLARVVEGSHHLHHPHYVGHQVSAPLPLAALCDFVSSFLNNGMAVYDMGPIVTAMEHNVLGWMAGKRGLLPRADDARWAGVAAHHAHQPAHHGRGPGSPAPGGVRAIGMHPR
ncbi:hypothetical protein [Cystobacter ferrugineus]|uniref:Pyridoxal-dependent decarboxylase n=1 Tax=Cystobacter ferrugineus TaxID=83449 RepID=A0A1L9BIW6_9BACT|nr:hypothetical protein [Cystobacter ferrugineus]OJH42197.1 hypothetical protein BON30_02995 [Cystobacter ferrugineus]